MVNILPSCENSNVFRARISRLTPTVSCVYVEGALYTRNSRDGQLKRIETVSFLTDRPDLIEIVFETEIRKLGLWSLFSFVVYEALVTSSADDLIARFTLPVFSCSGVLLEGPQLVLGNASNPTRDNLSSSTTHALSLLDSKSQETVKNIVKNFKLIRNEACDAVVTETSLLDDLKSVWTGPCVVADLQYFSAHEEVTLFSSETCKSNNHFARQVSAPEIVGVKSDSFELMEHEFDRQLSTWMVINGPMEARGSGQVNGSGYVADLSAAMSPCPIQVVDYELFKEHPAATKAARIQRFASRYALSQSQPLRPNADEMSSLNEIILQPMRDLSVMERELVLKFMWSLTSKKQALLKVILVSVDSIESSGDLEPMDTLVSRILSEWTPVDVDGALALLGEEIGKLSSKSVRTLIRKYAVGRLAAVASNAEIQLFMFQLVQSLRYDSEEDQSVASFLIGRASQDDQLATMLFWYLQCEGVDYEQVSEQLWSALGRSEAGMKIRDALELQCEFRERFVDIADVLSAPPLRALEAGYSKGEILRDAIRGNLSARAPRSVISRVNLSIKLNFPQVGGDAVEIPIPLDPNLSLVRVDESKSFCIKSAKAPFVVTCEVFNKTSRQVEIKRYMFKKGDDLRQDQLVIQFISLFDNLFKSYGLDLRLTPYKVLATSTDDGFIEFVADSNTLSSVLSNHGNDLLTYFRSIRPRADAPYGVDPAVLDAFARSCAGYCAITYVLGIGDRHLDNLLITTDGRLFHVDFGFILGRDPKPFPPPMKLCREMVDGMGGTGSVYYRSFVSKCTQAFLIIRRHASLLVSLLYLAAEANLKDMREQDPTLAILKVQKRLMPELSDEVAEQQMLSLINESTSALFPVMMEKLHKWAIYWRN